MSTIDILVEELTNDPLVRGYATMDFATMEASLNAVDRGPVPNLMDGSDLEAQIDPTEIAGLAADRILLIRSVVADTDLDLQTGTVDRSMAEAAFAGMTNTLANIGTNIQPNVTKSISRAEEIGVDGFALGDLQQAREISGVGV